MAACPKTEFVVRDHLDHAWCDEVVGFGLPPDVAEGVTVGVRDDNGNLIPAQISRACGKPHVYIVVDELPALGERRYALETTTEPVPAPPSVPYAVADGNMVLLSNGLISIRVPAAQPAPGAFPAPILGIRRGDGPWIGTGRMTLSHALAPRRVDSALLEQGLLWLTWRLHYECGGGEAYVVELKLFTGRHYVEITETSSLCRDARWEFSLREGLEPNHTWTHPHQVHGEKGRLCPIPFPDAGQRDNVGAVQLPIYSGIWVPDDYYYLAFLRRDGDGRDCIAAAGVNGGCWDYPYANQIDCCFSIEGDAFFRASIKAGHRRWLLVAADRDEVLGTRPFHRNSIHSAVKAYETPLDKVKDWTLDWTEIPAEKRPFLLADRMQLEHSRRAAEDYTPFHDYVTALDPELPGDYTYYHSGTHRTFEPDYRNDPAVLYVTASNDNQRRKQARFLKDVVMDGLANRRRGMLDGVGHCDPDSASINVGRGLRPWAALYDFAAAENAFSEDEQRLARATFAFFCYKINDPDYWPADHLTLRDDHPRSAHRTHWFPWRHSDWSFYNIDNIPHNFHGDLWSAAGCVAMAFPNHPRSRIWVNRTLEFWECELTQWIFPEGAWLESSTYTLNSMKDYLFYCRALANSRIRDYFSDPRLRSVFRFYAETLLPHDERIGGSSIPVLGDASYPNGFAYVLGWMAGLAADDPEFAGLMQKVWRATGEFLTEPGRFGLNFCDFLFLDPFLADRELPPRCSKHYPGLGAMLRHGDATGDDIYMFIKGGTIYSHFHEPEGTFLLWWGGMPLCDEFGVQYGKGTSDVANHNCIEVCSGSPCVYNKGDITRFVSLDAFDFVTVDAPIQQAYLAEGQGIWGFDGEMGPAGWHRRHCLLAKPFYLFIYDELECPHATTYHLSVKAHASRQDGAIVHFDGRFGTDLEVLFLDPPAPDIRLTEFDVGPLDKYGFQPPPNFYHQRQVHVNAAPGQDMASLLLPHKPDQPVKLLPDPETGGACIEIGPQVDRVMLFAKRRTVHTATIDYEGTAGIVRVCGPEVTLIQVTGSRIGIPGLLTIEGDGPFTAKLTPDNHHLTIDTDGVARWLAITSPNPNGTTPLRIPPGQNTITLHL